MAEKSSELDPHEFDKSVTERDRLLFDLLSNRNTAEFERSNILDSKASSMIGFAGIIIGLLATLISFIFDQLSLNSKLFAYYSSYRVILLAGIIVLALSIISSLFAYFVKPYEIVPENNHLIEEYAKKDRDICTILRITAQGISDAINKNKVIDDEKAKWVKYSLILFGIGMGLVVLFVCGLLMI